MTHEKLKEALMQGEEHEAAKLFQELLRQSVHAGLFETLAGWQKKSRLCAGCAIGLILRVFTTEPARKLGSPIWISARNRFVDCATAT
jgi:hypothetical protein